MIMTVEAKIQHLIEFLKYKFYVEKSIRVAEYARKMDVQRNGVYKWLKGENVMGTDKYFKTLEVLGITEESLFSFKIPQND